MNIKYKYQIFTVFFLSFFITHTIAVAQSPVCLEYYGITIGNFSSIQAAIDNAPQNAYIIIKNGTYSENLVINTPITLLGDNAATTIIDGSSQDSVIQIQVDEVTISNLTIQNSKKMFPKASIAINSNHNTITHNILQHSYYGIALINTAHNTLSNNIIRNNQQCGIYFSEAKENRLNHNFVDTHAFNGFGIYDFSNHNIITNNTLVNNAFYGINIRDSYNNKISGNILKNNTAGLHLPLPQFHTLFDNNVFYDNKMEFAYQPNLLYTSLPGCLVFVLLSLVFFKKILL